MKYRRLDSNGDYSFGRGNQDFILDADAVAQAVKTKLLLLQGEWWENTEEGLPAFQHILGVTGTPEHLNGADLLIQNRISETSGVTGISDYRRTFTDRNLSISCKLQTVFGETGITATI
jgi:hypothetical protein